jgi:type IV pilus assembly protein PilM
MAEKKSVLTLNLGSQRAGMARFGLGSKGALMLKEYAFAEMPGDPTTDGTRRAALTDAVRSLSGALKASGQSVNYSIPGQFLIAKFVKLPPLGEDQVDKIVGFEAQQAVPFPLAETVWDYQLMGKNEGEVEVGIVAVRSEHLNDLNGAVESAGLKTAIVDAAPVAIYNAFRYNYPEVTDCVLLVDLGARTTNLIFIEGRRAFISSFQTGGASVTQSIAKEMGMDYDSAEARKVADGFVNLGGNYADHEDPEIDAMSKVIRNALARIHGEIARRTNAYRQQQGGAAPTEVYLAGAGASMPFVKEVFEEKLRIPVNYFNALKNVSVGPRVDVEQVSGEAHTLGELVGLALREMACPMELDLSPKAVQASRDVGNRKPYLFGAAAALFSTLIGTWAYNSSAASGYLRKEDDLKAKIGDLERYDRGIKEATTRESTEKARADYIADAVRDQKYWVGMLNTVNNLLPDDQIWIVQLSPLDVDGNELIATRTEGSEDDNPFATGKNSERSSDKEEKREVDSLHLIGVSRSGENAGELALKFIKKLAGFKDDATIDPDSPTATYFQFDAKDETSFLQQYVKHEVGALDAKDGYAFHMKLPLKRKVSITASSKK